MNKVLRNKLVVILATVVIALAGLFVVNGLTSSKNEANAAGETPTLSVVAKNLSYADSNFILYAVGYTGVENTNSVQMLFWEEEQTEYKKGTENYSTANKGKTQVKQQECLIFYSNGIAAKDMVDNIYARAYVEINGVGYYSELLKYSVLEYVYEMREAGNLTIAQENAFTALLNYGSAMQTLLKHDVDRLANASFNKITVVNGTLADTTTSGRYLNGEKVTITANEPEEGMEFVNWTDKDGVEVSTTATAELTVNGANTYTANYKEVKDDTYYTEGLVFELNGEEYMVTGYTGSDTEVVIPATYEGKPVTMIGNGAFAYKSLTSVHIPDGIITIGDEAFYECGKLTRIDIPDSVITIGDEALRGCDRLTKIIIGKGVTSIGDNAFTGCVDLGIIEVAENNNSYKSIGWVLYTKDGKTLIKFPPRLADDAVILDTVESISDYAFQLCVFVKSIEIPESVRSIGENAFLNCTHLTSVTFKNPNGWKTSNGLAISSSDLTNTSTAATYLTSDYRSTAWTRS